MLSKLNKLLFAILLCTLYNAQNICANEQYFFERLSPDGGFVYGAITTIASDNNGLIWFGTQNGLYLYNNKSTRQYTTSRNQDGKAIAIQGVNRLLFDDHNKLWVICHNEIHLFNIDSNEFQVIYSNDSPSKRITSFAKYLNDQYLFTLNSTIYIISKELEISRIFRENSGTISDIVVSESGQIFMGSKAGNITTSSDPNGILSTIYSRPNTCVSSMSLYKDQLYIGYQHDGLDIISFKGELLSRHDKQQKNQDNYLPSNDITHIIINKKGVAYIASLDGVVIQHSNHNIYLDQSNTKGLPHNSIHALHLDKHDHIWLGTWAGGLAYGNTNCYYFEQKRDISNQVQYGVISSFEERDITQGEIWVGSEQMGLNIFDIETNSYTDNILDKSVKSMAKDDSGRLWVGTVNQGLYCVDQRGEVKHIDLEYLDAARCIISDINIQQDTVWISTRGAGVIKYEISSHKESAFYKAGSGGTNLIRQTAIMPNGDLLLCSDTGLHIKHCGESTFSTYYFNDDINNNICFALLAKDKFNYYIGTSSNGVMIFNTTTKEFTPFEHNSEFENAEIYTIQRDHIDHIWFSTNRGIYSYDSEKEVMHRYNTSDGVIGNIFNPLASFASSNGILFWGGTNGFNYINTKVIKINPIEPTPFITNITINNRNIFSYPNCEVNSQHTPNITQIKLPHDLNSFVFQPSSNNFLKAHNNSFKYMLEGYDKEFRTIQFNQHIIYTQVPPGGYKLIIYSSNNDGVWSQKPHTIDINIKAPLLLRWYFILLYIIVVTLVIYQLIKHNLEKIKLRQEIYKEQYQNEVNERTYSDKIKLFMNISHELRTPLNLISAPLNVLEEDKYISIESKHHLNVIRRNTNRLIKLINQILDFRMIEVGTLTPLFKPTNIITLSEQICSYFEYNINENRIEFTIEKSSSKIISAVDSDLLEKSLYNIISNAIKHTPIGSKISLSIAQKEIEPPEPNEGFCIGDVFSGAALEISVTNEGEGIPEENIPHIFERFYKSVVDHKSSSGIGLHLCQEYIKLHNGYIMVNSVLGGTTTFTIRIPSNNISSNSAEEPSIITHIELEESATPSHNNLSSKDLSLPIILIVEDNTELLYYLRVLLKNRYRCITARNGQIGYNLAVETSPDLIITDISMPQMGGVEMLEHIRENKLTHNTPVIMLTALSDAQTEISAIKLGADAFLSKPVDEKLLLAHIQRLISQGAKPTTIVNETITDSKSEFMQRLESIVMQNIKDENFDTLKLTDLLNISRSSLHRKLKAETGLSSSEYIRECRLNLATQLISKGMRNINEVSTYVGFNSSSYFCRSFKSKYGVTPLEYYTKHHKEPKE